MSYDIYLNSVPCDHCGRTGEHPETLNPTYNLTPIFDLALTGEPPPNAGVSEAAVVLLGKETDRPRGLRVLNGRKGADTIRQLTQALADLNDPAKRAAFVALEPPNKWGDLKGAIWVVEQMLSFAARYPDNVWEIQ